MLYSRRQFAAAGVGLTTALAALRAPALAEKMETFEVTKTDAEWQKILTPEQFNVLRKHGT